MLLNVFGPKNCHLGRLAPGMVQEFEAGIMVVARRRIASMADELSSLVSLPKSEILNHSEIALRKESMRALARVP